MKVTLDVSDNTADLVIEFLKTVRGVRSVKPVELSKAEILNNIKQAVKEVKLIKAGKLKGIPARDVFK